MNIPDLSPGLKQYRKFFVQAKQVEKVDPKVSWLLRTYAVQTCFKNPQITSNDKMALLDVLDELEAQKSCAGMSTDERAEHLLSFAMNVFLVGDNQDRSGNANQSTAKCFLSCATFFEAMRLFGELDPEIEEKRLYAMWKAADIAKALREGRTPTPGGFGENASNELEDAFGPGEPSTASHTSTSTSSSASTSRTNMTSSSSAAYSSHPTPSAPSAPSAEHDIDPWAEFEAKNTSTPSVRGSDSADVSTSNADIHDHADPYQHFPLPPPNQPSTSSSSSSAAAAAAAAVAANLPNFDELDRRLSAIDSESSMPYQGQNQHTHDYNDYNDHTPAPTPHIPTPAPAPAPHVPTPTAAPAPASTPTAKIPRDYFSTTKSDDPWGDFYAATGRANPETERRAPTSSGSGSSIPHDASYTGDANSISIRSKNTAKSGANVKDRYGAVNEATRLARHVISALSFDDTPTAVEKLSEALALLLPYKDQASEYM